MRGLACLLVLVAASAAAEAHPAMGPGMRPNRRPPRFDDLETTTFDAPDPCGTGKTWRVVEGCLKKQGAFTLAYDTPTLKVVQIPFGNAVGTTRLWLFVQRDKGPWTRMGFSGWTNAQTSLIGIVPFTAESGEGLRLDFGSAAKTTLSIEQNSVTRGIVRRVNSTICLPRAGSCQTITTACEAYVQGHLLWSFHAEVVWVQALGLRLRANTSHAGGVCTPIRSMLEDG